MRNRNIKIAWYGKHFGEEPPLVGTIARASGKHGKDTSGGAGTIFFSGCNLHCVFCQNYQISQEELGMEYSIEELVQIMLELQKAGAVTIDLVTPTPWWRLLKAAIIFARQAGLSLPVVWNSNAYETPYSIKQMAGLVDVYLPDFKYADDTIAKKYSCAPHYTQIAEAAIREMFNQVGRLHTEKGVARKGLIIRHLILPGHIENTFAVLEKIAAIDPAIHISLMTQYCPVYNAAGFPEINRRISEEELQAVEIKLKELRLKNGWSQGQETGETFLPDFTRPNPFTT
jgi:putative pyruvate formate lyase activating enzyme